jgi:nitrate reductase NapE component
MAKLLNIVDTTNILARTTLSFILSAILSFIIFPISFIALIGIFGLNSINFEYITPLLIGSCALFGNFFSWLKSDYKLINYKWLTGLIIVSILSAYIGSVKGMNAERSILPLGVPELRDTFIWCTLLTSLWSTLYWTVMKILNKTVRL